MVAIDGSGEGTKIDSIVGRIVGRAVGMDFSSVIATVGLCWRLQQK